jgi:hypothetical protein
MRLAPRTIALSFLALLAGALASGQSPIPVSPPQTSPATTGPASARSSPSKSADRSKPATKKALRRKPRAQVVPEKDPSKKVVVRHGGSSEALPQITPVAPQHQDSEERRKAGQLLTATDANLKTLLGRTLTPEQQATVAQARQFMGQSRAALDAGDLTQGYNLASKANTLSEELVKK